LTKSSIPPQPTVDLKNNTEQIRCSQQPYAIDGFSILNTYQSFCDVFDGTPYFDSKTPQTSCNDQQDVYGTIFGASPCLQEMVNSTKVVSEFKNWNVTLGASWSPSSGYVIINGEGCLDYFVDMIQACYGSNPLQTNYASSMQATVPGSSGDATMYFFLDIQESD
jgi:hypothetical protein